jgi:cytochrome oxidase Cu insertion factor (SCO1/SenC/PrrC family)
MRLPQQHSYFLSSQDFEVEESKQKNKGRWKLFAVIAVCAAPMIASYLTYYVIKPESRTNYGSLIDPRAYPIPPLGATTLDGKPVALDAYKGKWMMVQVSDADCQEPCKKRLHDMRQLRLAQGKDKDRIERIWLVTDDKPLETMVMREYDGTHMLRVKPDVLNAWLPVDQGTVVSDHIYLIDPLGNLMMRYPKDADPNKIKKDLSKLLKASRVG